MKKAASMAALFVCLALLLFAQDVSMPVKLKDFAIKDYAIGSFPGSPQTGQPVYANNGASSSDCTVGGGSTKVLCIYNGSAWVAVSGGGGSSYTPLSAPSFYKQISFVSGFNRWESYTYTGGCADANSDASGNGMDTVSVLPWWWLKSSGDTTVCAVNWPYVQTWGGAVANYFSGSTPAWHQALARFGKQAVNGGTFFFGWSQDANNPLTNFVGCRAVGTGNWFAVVRTAGADTGTPADTGATNDTASHKLKVSNGTSAATANSITCTVDAASATISATVPSGASWKLVAGVIQAGGTASVFRASMFEVWFQGLP